MPEETPSESQNHKKVGLLLKSEFDVPKSSVSSIIRLGKSPGNKLRLMLWIKNNISALLWKRSPSFERAKGATPFTYVTPDLTIKEWEVNKALRDELRWCKESDQ